MRPVLIPGGTQHVKVSMSWNRIKTTLKKGFMGCCKEFLKYKCVIMKRKAGTLDEWTLAHKYSGNFGSTSVMLPPISLPLSILSNGDLNCPLKFAIINKKTKEEFDSVETTVGEIQAGKRKHHGSMGRHVLISYFKLWDRRPMAEYVQNGWTIATTAAIDFSSISEHDASSGKFTESEAALMSIG